MSLFHKPLLSGVTTGSGTVTPAETLDRREHTFYIVGSSGVSAGAVQIETAPSPSYTGTWAPLGNAVTVVASSAAVVNITGAFGALRARVSSTVTDGTVSVEYFGN